MYANYPRMIFVCSIRKAYDYHTCDTTWAGGCLCGLQVIVHNKTKAWKLELLPQNVWLDLSEGDSQICRTLSPSGTDGKPEVETVDYTVTITTSDIKGAGTDANVFIELVGDKGSSGRRLLDNSKNNFERAQVNQFRHLRVFTP